MPSPHRTDLAAFVSLALLSVPGAGSAQQTDEPPTRPEGVRAALYDGAGGELFWQRASDDRGVRGYEVTRDGMPLGVFDALSLYDPALRAGTRYTFTVAAVDSAGQRSAPASAVLGGDGVSAGALAPPANLRAEAYSATAGELFWDRASVPGLQYVITRDGVEIARNDGTSHFDPGRTPGVDHVYAVVAVDDGGNRSAPASVTLAAEASSGAGQPALPVVPPAMAPPSTDTTPMFPETDATPSPKNITLAVYSDSTAELNWTRPLFGSGIRTNEILRDGMLIDTIPGGGNSYVDTMREAGRGYRYEIVAINRAGRASSVFIDIGTPPEAASGGGELPAALDGAIDRFFDLVSGAALARVATAARRLADPDAIGARPIGPDEPDFPGQTPRDRYACPGGGETTLTRTDPDFGDIVLRRFEACRVGAVTLTGRGTIGREPIFGSSDEREFVRLQNVELLDARDGSSVAAESVTVQTPAEGSGGLQIARELRVAGPGGDSSAELFDLRATGGDPRDVRVRAENLLGVLPGGAARLRTGEPLLVGDNGQPSSGTVIVVLTGSNAQGLELRAGNGNPDTFTLTSTANGAVTAYELPWTGARTVGVPSPDDGA